MREKKDINIEIGGNIQVAREQAGYTQDTLSEMLGMTPNHLSATPLPPYRQGHGRKCFFPLR